MSDADLRAALARAAGAPDDRPALGPVWTAGRVRRRRARVLRATAALVVVLVLAGGGIALAAGGGGDEDVKAGTGGGAEEGPPPAEPTDGLVVLEVEAGSAVDGVPVVEPGRSLVVTYAGPVDYFARGRLATWERWDGGSWAQEVGLVAGDTGSGGFEGDVVALDPPPTVPDDTRAGAGPDTFPVPDEVDGGWYRICMPMVSTATFLVSGDSARVDGTVADTPTIEEGRRIRPCAQVRVAGADDEPVELRPPAEPDGEVTLVASASTIEAGEDVEVQLAGDLDGWVAGATALWEEWDGDAWSVTHELRARTSADGLYALVAPVPIIDAPPLPVEGAASPAPRSIVTPVVRPGWYRICAPVAFRDEPSAPPTRSLHPCALVEVVGEPGAALPWYPERPEPGEAATWVVDPADPPSPEDTSVALLLRRTSCGRGGGDVALRPGIEVEPGRVTVMFTIGLGQAELCRTDQLVPARLDLGEPLGDRVLQDGTCLTPPAADLEACAEVTRWPAG